VGAKPPASVTRTPSTERIVASSGLQHRYAFQLSPSRWGGSGVSSNLWGFRGRRTSPQEAGPEWEGLGVFSTLWA
jgi:hypothetical protein